MGSSEEIYWNMAKNNRKLDAKMPSCPHFCHNLFIMNCLLVVVASVLVRALPSLTPMLKNKLFRLYRMIQSTFIAGFWGNAQLAENASGIIYIVDL
ncbi:hypothetical protein DWX04_06880 [Phocaeicola vulgatus]|jgi:hypothetical protein|uniref:Uncharacterized protein n=2 Tax=Phocaeicola vulgatus TaxID=821 RepID=A0A412QXA5_PHOVU|nr:hypothetical protein DWX04_06880 [Phocaeicola vulgatus]